eukprot:TRINITY_DN10386_c0_g1_i4.p1 TRINITY_DN10386_c0_g1~~TRINITY_DN10386_c0_g1_i4.p1  ORF type:complete len:539 (+),score=106.02 TRINITY_DN10386_c0_g1_i4:121-1737(+)
MRFCRALLWTLSLVLHILCSHVTYYGVYWSAGIRRLFAKEEFVHLSDLSLAIELATGSSSSSSTKGGGGSAEAAAKEDAPGRADGKKKIALLFMVRDRLIHEDLWRLWLASERQREEPRLSLYFHLADVPHGGDTENADDARLAPLRTLLPGATRIVPTVATGWCELVAAEVALLRAALVEDPDAVLFVLLPHDSVPLASLDATLARLATGDSASSGALPLTKMCPSGVRGMDVPNDCSHAIEPHWARFLIFKHHQWMSFSRAHAERMTNQLALDLAVSIFREDFTAQPLCSDEVVPLLALALPEDWLNSSKTDGRTLHALPLYKSASSGLAGYEQGLREIGVESRCILYAPWPGCRGYAGPGESKKVRSPVDGGGLTAAERDNLLAELASRGVLFGRKLGTGGGSAVAHMELLNQRAAGAQLLLPEAPPRLFPEDELPCGPFKASFLGCAVHLRWLVATGNANMPVWMQFALGVLMTISTSLCCDRLGVVPKMWFRYFAVFYLVIHFVGMFTSVVLFEEYSLLEPLRKLKLLEPVEL